MASKKQSSPRVSLASELSVLESAVDGVRIVLEHVTMQASVYWFSVNETAGCRDNGETVVIGARLSALRHEQLHA